MGSDDALAYPEDGEGPVRRVHVEPFELGRHAVTNAQFELFVQATGYVTDAERFGASFVFSGLLAEGFPPTRAVAAAPWWREVPGAHWRHPQGPSSSVFGAASASGTCDRSALPEPSTSPDLRDHPVVHVSWNDAAAYCAWSGLSLPTEAQWEFAARGGLARQPFPWGGELLPGGRHRMNVWNGSFPDRNSLADGYLGTCPVGAFEPNGFGLHNMTGNVWEWTIDPFDRADGGRPGESPGEAPRALRGGSYLCHASYCRRYRVSARMANTPESSTGNIGFRCARAI